MNLEAKRSHGRLFTAKIDKQRRQPFMGMTQSKVADNQPYSSASGPKPRSESLFKAIFVKVHVLASSKSYQTSLGCSTL